MRRVAATVNIVTTSLNGRAYGMTATAVTSVSADPPTMLVCVNQSAGLHPLLLDGDSFCVNVLRACQVAEATAFSGGLPGGSRFAVGDWLLDAGGVPYLADAQASIFCRKVAALPHATHTLFIGEVHDVRVEERVEPLLYADGAYATALRSSAN
jgi:flavin reductase